MACRAQAQPFLSPGAMGSRIGPLTGRRERKESDVLVRLALQMLHMGFHPLPFIMSLRSCVWFSVSCCRVPSPLSPCSVCLLPPILKGEEDGIAWWS